MAIIISTAVPGFVEASENVCRDIWLILHNNSEYSDPKQVAVPSGIHGPLQHNGMAETIELDQENISSKPIDSEIPRLFS
jgi:hypothetical protein